MKKGILRVIALVLVAALVADPSTLHAMAVAPTHPVTDIRTARFQEEAITAALISFRTWIAEQWPWGKRSLKTDVVEFVAAAEKTGVVSNQGSTTREWNPVIKEGIDLIVKDPAILKWDPMIHPLPNGVWTITFSKAPKSEDPAHIYFNHEQNSDSNFYTAGFSEPGKKLPPKGAADRVTFLVNTQEVLDAAHAYLQTLTPSADYDRQETISQLTSGISAMFADEDYARGQDLNAKPADQKKFDHALATRIRALESEVLLGLKRLPLNTLTSNFDYAQANLEEVNVEYGKKLKDLRDLITSLFDPKTAISRIDGALSSVDDQELKKALDSYFQMAVLGTGGPRFNPVDRSMVWRNTLPLFILGAIGLPLAWVALNALVPHAAAQDVVHATAGMLTELPVVTHVGTKIGGVWLLSAVFGALWGIAHAAYVDYDRTDDLLKNVRGHNYLSIRNKFRQNVLLHDMGDIGFLYLTGLFGALYIWISVNHWSTILGVPVMVISHLVYQKYVAFNQNEEAAKPTVGQSVDSIIGKPLVVGFNPSHPVAQQIRREIVQVTGRKYSLKDYLQNGYERVVQTVQLWQISTDEEIMLDLESIIRNIPNVFRSHSGDQRWPLIFPTPLIAWIGVAGIIGGGLTIASGIHLLGGFIVLLSIVAGLIALSESDILKIRKSKLPLIIMGALGLILTLLPHAAAQDAVHHAPAVARALVGYQSILHAPVTLWLYSILSGGTLGLSMAGYHLLRDNPLPQGMSSVGKGASLVLGLVSFSIALTFVAHTHWTFFPASVATGLCYILITNYFAKHFSSTTSAVIPNNTLARGPVLVLPTRKPGLLLKAIQWLKSYWFSITSIIGIGTLIGFASIYLVNHRIPFAPFDVLCEDGDVAMGTVLLGPIFVLVGIISLCVLLHKFWESWGESLSTFLRYEFKGAFLSGSFTLFAILGLIWSFAWSKPYQIVSNHFYSSETQIDGHMVRAESDIHTLSYDDFFPDLAGNLTVSSKSSSSLFDDDYIEFSIFPNDKATLFGFVIQFETEDGLYSYSARRASLDSSWVILPGQSTTDTQLQKNAVLLENTKNKMPYVRVIFNSNDIRGWIRHLKTIRVATGKQHGNLLLNPSGQVESTVKIRTYKVSTDQKTNTTQNRLPLIILGTVSLLLGFVPHAAAEDVIRHAPIVTRVLTSYPIVRGFGHIAIAGVLMTVIFYLRRGLSAYETVGFHALAQRRNDSAA